MKRVHILSIASEIYPLVKTGGLADVVAALPGALALEKVTMRSLLPGYAPVIAGLADVEIVHRFEDLFGGAARLLTGTSSGLDLFILDAPHLYARPGNPYLGPDGKDWPDNAQRFAALARVGADLGHGLLPGYIPDIVQAHDWQAALAAAYLHYSDAPRPATIVTIHNLAFQGLFEPDLLAALGLPPASFDMDGVEYYGSIGFLKAGLRLADRLTTVSPTYAAEIQTAPAGMGLEGLLRARSKDLSGILNGIDIETWNPTRDAHLAATYSAKDRAPRVENKIALQVQLGLEPDPKALVFGVISRLSSQKGLDLLLASLETLLQEGAQLAMLGTGEKALEAGFMDAAAAHPGRIACVIGFDEALAHLIQAGAEALLVPSRFEPCGLTQLCALRYGAVPVVARVGGLADTIIDANEMALGAAVATGLQFAPVDVFSLQAAIRRASALFKNRAAWKRLRTNGMTTDVSWGQPASHYAVLYRDLIAARKVA